MSRKKAILKIRLKSDLCAGSGYSFAGIVDSDVCYNQNGFPYILGRRIKGCLREAAELIEAEDIDKIFGTGGDSKPGSLMVGNAYPENFAHMDDEISKLKSSGSPYADYVGEQSIIGQFTSVKSQTKIDSKTGVAKENSLRYTRVVNRFSPVDGTENVFCAEIEYDCDTEQLLRIVKAFRHMGMNRNRGLGNISCTLEDIKELDTKPLPQVGIGQEQIMLTYLVKNVQPLVMSGSSDVESDNFVRGQSVLGMLAGEYLKYEGSSPEDEAFQDIFVRGKASFSNLTVSSCQEDIHTYTPAPLYINKLKISKKLINVIKHEPEDVEDVYKKTEGNIPQKMKNQFMYQYSDGSIHLMELEKDIVLHHSTRAPYDEGKSQENPDGREGILYSMEVLQEGQYLAGTIVTEARYKNIILALLDADVLRFGKSKSAQYGACKVVKVVETPMTAKKSFKAGDKVLVTFNSDAVFTDDRGYTTRGEAVAELVAKQLGMTVVDPVIYMETDVVYGYNTTWNLKKPSVPVVKAGSAMMYTLTEDAEVDAWAVGERCHEGFGQVDVCSVDAMSYVVKVRDDAESSAAELNACKSLVKSIMLSEIADMLKSKAYGIKGMNMSPSTLGRVTLMLRESLNKTKLSSVDRFKDFYERVESIKRDGERDEIKKLVKGNIFKADSKTKVAELDEKSFFNGLVYYKSEDEEFVKLIDLYREAVADDDQFEKLLCDMWGEYLMHILVYQKYIGKNK
ncbi:MAG: hypothetical protein IJX85_04670 [Lachnospiraceae bacterium]|nr:hypothetical protein [Lachnospiraceae bacterium]